MATGSDDARSAVFVDGHLATVSNWMTPTVAAKLEFHELVPYKGLLKQFFSSAPWTDADAARLSDLVAPKLEEGWQDELVLDGGLVVRHGRSDGRYRIVVKGTGPRSTLWDRVFEGPVRPEPTPHPRKVKFDLGGEPAPGIWYRRSDDVDDERVTRLFEEQDVTDVMVAGDFVTIGLARGSRWEERLDQLLSLVAELFPPGERGESIRTRDELVAEGKRLDVTRPDQLHLLDPDDPAARNALQRALLDEDARVRRVAVVVLAESDDDAVAHRAIRRGLEDASRIVQRAAVDAGADRGDGELRSLFEQALSSTDPWVRWKAVRALGDLDPAPSRDAIAALTEDEDFQVEFEVARVLRSLES